jgi:hypothetical protein
MRLAARGFERARSSADRRRPRGHRSGKAARLLPLAALVSLGGLIGRVQLGQVLPEAASS